MVDLLTGLCAIEAALAKRAVDHLLACPKTYDLDAVLVPATRTLLDTVTPTLHSCNWEAADSMPHPSARQGR